MVKYKNHDHILTEYWPQSMLEVTNMIQYEPSHMTHMLEQ